METFLWKEAALELPGVTFQTAQPANVTRQQSSAASQSVSLPRTSMHKDSFTFRLLQGGRSALGELMRVNPTWLKTCLESVSHPRHVEVGTVEPVSSNGPPSSTMSLERLLKLPGCGTEGSGIVRQSSNNPVNEKISTFDPIVEVNDGDRSSYDCLTAGTRSRGGALNHQQGASPSTGPDIWTNRPKASEVKEGVKRSASGGPSYFAASVGDGSEVHYR